MSSMVIDRRQTIAGLAAAAFLPSIGWTAPSTHLNGFLSAFSTPDQTHGVALLGADGTLKKTLEINQRGHGFALSRTTQKGVAFARRPGTQAHVIDLRTFEFGTTIQARDDRHFYGHGCFSHDGRWLFISENDFEHERGVIGVYDAADGFSRRTELPSHGIGPHEIGLMDDGRTLIVANGGILTHPSAPRLNLNIDDMRPSLVMIDAYTGALKSRTEPPAHWHKLSIRHFDINRQGDIVVAMQWEGEATDHPPLLAMVQPGTSEFVFLKAEIKAQRAMKNYCGSVRFNIKGDQVIASSPRGDICTVWNLNGDLLTTIEMSDGCGVEGYGTGFVLTGGSGEVLRVNAESSVPVFSQNHSDIMWDNHLRGL